jgi:DNA polymerase III beta subunit-like protein
MKYENGIFDATIGELRALTTYASTDETRPHIASVCFDVEKHRVAATDGHRLMVIDAASVGFEGHKGEFMVNTKRLQAALRGMGTKKERVRVSCDAKAITIESRGISSALETVNVAKFPAIDNVIPDPASMTPAASVCFNAAYLGALGALADIAESLKARPCKAELRLGDVLDPARVDAEFAGEGKAIVVVMPMRK